jgi:hypothetical protein
MKIVFKCLDCYQWNRTYLGTDDYEPRQFEFSFVTEVFNHLMSNRDHFVEALIEKDEDEE